MIDMLAALGQAAVVHYLDTHFLFAETHELRDRLAARYSNVRFVNAGTTLTPEEQAARHGDALWSRDPSLCCQLRKVEPMRALLAGADAWMTGIRRGQSADRAAARAVEWDQQFEVVKVSPLAEWTRERVWDYVRSRDVPYSRLHDQGYPTFGCTHCTSAVSGARPADYSRIGRWAGHEKTECGLHQRPGAAGSGNAGQQASTPLTSSVKKGST